MCVLDYGSFSVLHVVQTTYVMGFSRCACVSGFLKRFWGTLQWTVFAAATVAMFTISLVGAVRNTVMIELHIIKLMCHVV